VGFQDDFGDRPATKSHRTMVKRGNYPLQPHDPGGANALIAHNSERIDKVLRPPARRRLITSRRCDDEIAPTKRLVHAAMLICAHPELSWATWRSSIAPTPEAGDEGIAGALGHSRLTSCGGAALLRPAREINGHAGLPSPAGEPGRSVSLLRVLNVPRPRHRKTTVAALTDASAQLGLPLWRWSAIRKAVRSLAGRSAKGLFAVQRTDRGSGPAASRTRPLELCATGDGTERLPAELITGGH